jgi:hypothetical protein
VKRQSTSIGRSGEYYVCYLLERVGCEATRSDGRFDVVAVRPDGRIISIEVKTCYTTRGASAGFRIGKSSADWFALCIDGNHGPTVLFMRGDDPLFEQSFVRIKTADFTPAALTDTLRELAVGHL